LQSSFYPGGDLWNGIVPVAPLAEQVREIYLMLNIVRISAWLLATAVIVLSLVSPWLRSETDVPHDLEHFAIFAATGLAFGLGYSRRYFAVAVALVIFTGAIEIAQIAVPGRHARLSDFMVDALAACIGLLSALFAPMHKLEGRG
jgi:VanZ family protein